MKHTIKKYIALFNVLLILLSCTQNVFAVTVSDNVTIYAKGECDYTLQANDGNGFYPLTCTYVEYIDETGVGHPAYCVNRGIDGIGEYYSYDLNLTEIMQDQRLWRVAVNGYPNKTAAELGVANDFDAFFATKQAVYSILGNFNIDTHYRAINERGEKIIAAIRKMVNEGLYGTTTYKNPIVNINKNGNIITETIGGSKYLVQNYTVTSAFSLKSYQVTIENAPAGVKIFDANGKETSTCATNKFKVAIPFSSLERDINFTIYIKNAEVKTYPVFYGKSSIAGTQNYMVTANSFELADTQTTLKINTNNANIEIVKKDNDTGEVIPDTTFSLYNLEGKEIATTTTDSKGKAKFTKLYPGTYTIKEKKSNKNYVLSVDNKNVTVKYGETLQTEFTNQKKTGKIKVVKVDKDHNEIKLEGVTFEIFDKNNKVIQTLTTNKNGEATSKELNIGEEYKVREKSTRSEYILSDRLETVILKENEIRNITFENEIKTGKIKVIKVDKDNHEIKLEGVVFEILDENGNVVDTLKTDSKGEAASIKLPINQTYTIVEKEAKQGYKKTDKIHNIKLVQDEITAVTIENEKEKGNLRIQKVDKDNNKIMLSKVGFDLYSEEFKKIIGSYVTNDKGEISVNDLRIGKYNLIEKVTSKWYNLASDTEIEIKGDETSEIKIENELKKGQIRVIKVDKENNKIKLKNVEFDILDEKGNVVQHLVTDNKGEATSKKLPVNQKYTIKETKTQEQYALARELYTVTLEENKIKDITFENELKKGKIEIYKTDSEDKEIKLKGVEFEVLNSSDELVEKITTDENGYAITSELIVGEYKIKEVKTENTHILNDEILNVEVKHGKAQTLNITNERMVVKKLPKTGM